MATESQFTDVSKTVAVSIIELKNITHKKNATHN
jgi:hypothetical protein